MAKLSIKDLDLKDKTVFIRVDFNVPLAAGGKDNGPPGLRPQYHANYYAAFVIGPDGHNIEVVCHDPVER